MLTAHQSHEYERASKNLPSALTAHLSCNHLDIEIEV